MRHSEVTLKQDLQKVVRRIIRPIHVRLRSQKIELFAHCCSGQPETLLDVGGGLGIAGEFGDLYARFSRVVVLNISLPDAGKVPSLCIEHIRADGCGLPFGDKSIDWVFSNAVIEHVGGYKRQEQFANEIRRVAAKGYFVTTPNRYFPIEPHALLPFYQFLSPAWQRRVVRFSPGYLQEYEEINLLSSRQMKRLFPEARVVKSGVPVVGNSLIAWFKRDL